MNLTQEYFFQLKALDKKPITRKTGVETLKVKTYKIPTQKRDILFWYDVNDVINPKDIIQPGISMFVKSIEEIEPNFYAIKDLDNREFSLKLLYVSEQEIR